MAASLEEASDMPEHSDEEAAMDELPEEEEPSMDDDPQEHEGETKEEISPEQLRNLHAKVDADASGKLSLEELLHFYHETQKLVATNEAPGLMQEIDVDKDGKLSLDEVTKDMYGGGKDGDHDAHKAYEAHEGDKFSAADGNSDGLLDEKELAAYFHPGVHDNVLQTISQHAMDEKDADNDGLLTIEELWGKIAGGPEAYEGSLKTFNKLDKDGSGKIDMKELLSLESGHVHILEDMESFIQFADTDGDQHVTIEELHAAHGTFGNEEHNAEYYFMEMVQHHEL